jgi:hypothetical protein
LEGKSWVAERPLQNAAHPTIKIADEGRVKQILRDLAIFQGDVVKRQQKSRPRMAAGSSETGAC